MWPVTNPALIVAFGVAIPLLAGVLAGLGIFWLTDTAS